MVIALGAAIQIFIEFLRVDHLLALGTLHPPTKAITLSGLDFDFRLVPFKKSQETHGILLYGATEQLPPRSSPLDLKKSLFSISDNSSELGPHKPFRFSGGPMPAISK